MCKCVQMCVNLTRHFLRCQQYMSVGSESLNNWGQGLEKVQSGGPIV